MLADVRGSDSVGDAGHHQRQDRELVVIAKALPDPQGHPHSHKPHQQPDDCGCRLPLASEDGQDRKQRKNRCGGVQDCSQDAGGELLSECIHREGKGRHQKTRHPQMPPLA